MLGVGVGAAFRQPVGLAIDDAGQFLYVCDSGNHVIRKVNVVSQLVSTVGGMIGGFAAAGSNDGVGAAASFNSPNGVVYRNGNLYITARSGNNLRKIVLATSTVTTIAGGGFSSFGIVMDGIGTDASFNNLQYACINAVESYALIPNANKVRRVNLNTRSVTTRAGGGGPSQFNEPGFPVNGVGTSALFLNPKGMCMSPNGVDIYISDNGNHQIRRTSLTTLTTTTVSGNLIGYEDGTSNPFIFSEIIFSHFLSFLDDFFLFSVFYFTGVGTVARFNAPLHCIGDRNTNTLYIADSANGCVRAIDLSNLAVTTVAGSSAYDGTGTAVNLSPVAIAVGVNNTIYVSDSSKYSIRSIHVPTRTVRTIAGTGFVAWSPADGQGTTASVSKQSYIQ